MLQIKDLTYRIEGRPLLTNATATIPAGHKVGLVGRHGTGKTTLLRLLEAGRLPVPQHFKVALVAQAAPATETSVVDEILASDTGAQLLLQEEADLLAKIDALRGDAGREEVASLCVRLEQVERRLTASGVESAEATVRKIAYGLGFSADMADGPVSKLSGAGACGLRSPKPCTCSQPSFCSTSPRTTWI